MHPYIGFIDTYSLMLLLGTGLGVFLMFLYLLRVKKISKNLMSSLLTAVLLCILTGAIVSILTQNLYSYLLDKEAFSWKLGFNFYGACLGLVTSFALVWLLWLRKVDRDVTLGILTITPVCIAFGFSLMRIGCFLKGCCFGVETDAWYGVRLPSTTQEVIPINLFESIFLLILGAILSILAFRFNFKYNLCLGIICYCLFRFFTEDLRKESLQNFVFGLKPASFWSLFFLITTSIIFIVCIIIDIRKKKHAS